MKKLIFFLPIALIISACGGDSEETTESDYVETEYDKKIADYLEDKDIKPERRESGLYVHTEAAGSDEKPTLDSYLTLNYEGRLLDGTVFEGTNGEATTFPFTLGETISGWQEGIPLFGKGGKGTLIIPPDLGYGATGSGPVPGDEVLVFDIEIIDFADTPPPPPIDMSIDYSEEIEAYMDKEGLEATTKTDTRMYIIVEEPGNEEHPTLDSYLTLNYEGYLLDGTSFDGTGGSPTTFSFTLGQTILGWQEGIPYFGRGGKGKLIIPPYIGYGERGSGTIPPNAVLVFDIEIIDWSSLPPGNM